jgi:hypothetical protein
MSKFKGTKNNKWEDGESKQGKKMCYTKTSLVQ